MRAAYPVMSFFVLVPMLGGVTRGMKDWKRVASFYLSYRISDG